MRLLLIATTALIPFFAGQAAANRASCAALYQNGPRTLAGHRLIVGTNFEKDERGAGYGLAYADRGGARLTLFFYDKRRRRVENQDAAVEVTAQAILLGNAFETANARDLELELTDPVYVGDAPIFVATLSGNLRGRFVEQVAVVAHKDCFVSVRYTPAVPSAQAIDRILKEFAAHLVSG